MIQDQVKKLKLNVTNIKSFLIKKNSESRRIRIQKNSELERSEKLQKIKEKEKKIEAPKTGIGGSLKRITSTIFSGPMSLFDKIMNFLGYILLGLIVNELPKIITSIRDFFDKNKWIIKGLKFFIDAIGTSIMGVAKLVAFLSNARQKQIADQRSIIDKSINDLSSTFNQQEKSLSTLLANLNKPSKPTPQKTTPPPRPMSQQPFAPGGRPAVRPVPYGPGGSSTGSGRGQFNFRRPQSPQKFAKGGEVKRSPSSNTGSANRNTFTRGETGRQKAARQSINYFSVFKDSVSKLLSTSKIEKNNNKKFKDLFELIKSMPSLFETDKNKRSPGRRGRSGGESLIPDQPIEVDDKEVIGKVGSTGMSTGPHIHLEAVGSNKTIPESLRKNIMVGGKSLTSNNYPNSSPVGDRFHPILQIWKFHAGEDWGIPENTPIMLRGGLKFVKYISEGSDPRFSGYGNVTVIQDTDGKQYFLAHLNSGPTNLAALKKKQDEKAAENIPGSNNAEKVWNFFKSKQLSDIAVAGIMGNVDDESTFNPRARGKGMGPNGTDAIGLFQWGEKARWASLVAWAQKEKRDPWSVDTQLRYAWHEMGTTESSTLPALRAAKTPSEAAELFRRKFERGSGGIPDRKILAEKWYKKYKGKEPPKPQPRPATPSARPATPASSPPQSFIDKFLEGIGLGGSQPRTPESPIRRLPGSGRGTPDARVPGNNASLNTSGSSEVATIFLLNQTVETYVPVPMAYPVPVKSSSGSYSPSPLSDIWNA
jgi:hypothetical protein